MAGRFVLPKTVQARNWVNSTDTLRTHLKQRLATVRERADAKRKEADEIEGEVASLEQAIALLDQLLPPKQIGAATGQPALAAPFAGRTSHWSAGRQEVLPDARQLRELRAWSRRRCAPCRARTLHRLLCQRYTPTLGRRGDRLVILDRQRQAHPDFEVYSAEWFARRDAERLRRRDPRALYVGPVPPREPEWRSSGASGWLHLVLFLIPVAALAVALLHAGGRL